MLAWLSVHLLQSAALLLVDAAIRTPPAAGTSSHAEGAFSELMQHEIDHLDGVLSIDRMTDPRTICTRAEFELRHQQESRTPPRQRHLRGSLHVCRPRGNSNRHPYAYTASGRSNSHDQPGGISAARPVVMQAATRTPLVRLQQPDGRRTRLNCTWSWRTYSLSARSATRRAERHRLRYT